MATKTILLDVGGTFIKCSDGRKIPTHSNGSRDEITASLREAADGADRVAVAIPGPFDYSNGVFLMKHKFAAAYGQSFRAMAQLPESTQLRFAHDVNAVLIGAIRMRGLEASDAALVTLGTGLGFSYATAGKVQCGPDGSPLLSLWNKSAEEGGILEDRLSARGISAAYARLSGQNGCTPLQIAQMAYAGDSKALQVYSDTGTRLGKALRPVLDSLGIRTLLLGGQISASASLMLEPLQNELPAVTIAQVPDGAVFEGLRSLFETH